MPARDPKTTPKPRAVRCLTRALKNAQYLRKLAPEQFGKDPGAEGFGTGIPMEILRGLHRLRPDSPVLNRHPKVADFLRKNRLPLPGRQSRDALFSGTVHFAPMCLGYLSKVEPTALRVE
jgi:hypothetical protein